MKTFTEPKIVIAVSGDPRVGKTTLLLEFIDRLKAKSRFTPGSFCQLLSRGKKGRDKCVIGVVDDIIVGIGTKGDSATEIFRNFKFFQDSHCQIVFTAVRRKAEETSRMALEMILDHCQMLKFKEIEKAKDTSSVFLRKLRSTCWVHSKRWNQLSTPQSCFSRNASASAYSRLRERLGQNVKVLNPRIHSR